MVYSTSTMGNWSGACGLKTGINSLLDGSSKNPKFSCPAYSFLYPSVAVFLFKRISSKPLDVQFASGFLTVSVSEIQHCLADFPVFLGHCGHA